MINNYRKRHSLRKLSYRESVTSVKQYLHINLSCSIYLQNYKNTDITYKNVASSKYVYKPINIFPLVTSISIPCIAILQLYKQRYNNIARYYFSLATDPVC